MTNGLHGKADSDYEHGLLPLLSACLGYRHRTLPPAGGTIHKSEDALQSCATRVRELSPGNTPQLGSRPDETRVLPWPASYCRPLPSHLGRCYLRAKSLRKDGLFVRPESR